MINGYRVEYDHQNGWKAAGGFAPSLGPSLSISSEHPLWISIAFSLEIHPLGIYFSLL